MKYWQETGQLVSRLVRLGLEGRASALATMTRIEGSAYRRPGAKLLIEDDGAVLGGVSGGCLEEDLQTLRDVLHAECSMDRAPMAKAA